MGNGTVWLAGAGCSRKVISAEVLDVIRSADVVVYDDLIDHAILLETRREAELIAVGKRYEAHKREQEDIIALLIALAKEGKRVVRLKGGDPFVFGRGGEEYLAIHKAGLPCHVLPGVSFAVAAPERMGIPVTHRGTASSFTVVTGHPGKGCEATEEDYSVLAGLKGTLVFLMGVHKAEEISRKLIEAGKAPETPAAVLADVYGGAERRLDGILSELGSMAEGITQPAVIVVGPAAVFCLRDAPKGSLAGRSFLVTGTDGFVRKTCDRLEKEGAFATPFPCMQIVPAGEPAPDPEFVPKAAGETSASPDPVSREAASGLYSGQSIVPVDLSAYQWIVFTSANGVRVFFDAMRKERRDIRELTGAKFACIGPGTADVLSEQMIHTDLIPEIYSSDALGRALAAAASPGDKVLLLRAKRSSPLLQRELEKAGISYTDHPVYDITAIRPPIPITGRRFDAVVFASAGGVRAFLADNMLPEGALPVCIGEYTADELERLTGQRGLVAHTSTAEGIVEICKKRVQP